MTKRFILLIAILAMAAMVSAQGNPEQPNMATAPQNATNAPGQVAAGTEVLATLDQKLSTKTSHVGDNFTATVQQNVNDANGTVVIPAGSKVNGQVVESEKGKTLPELRGKGKLNMMFSNISLPNGSTVPIQATLLSVHSTGASAGKEGEVSGGISGKQTAKDVGIAAGAGAVLGLLFGHAIKGLAIGAAAGGGYVLATQGKDVELPAQTGLKLRLESNVAAPSGP
jgi:hypothetical protein